MPNEVFLGGVGNESYPQSIKCKGGLWSFFKSGSKLLIKEYGGERTSIVRLRLNNFVVTPALNIDSTINHDRVWIWYIDIDSNLKMVEIEPFSIFDPTITYSKDIAENVLNLHAFVQESDVIRVFILFNSFPVALVFYKYRIITDLVPVIVPLQWGDSRVPELSSYVQSAKDLFVSYEDVSSPSNVYLEGYDVGETVYISGDIQAGEASVSGSINAYAKVLGSFQSGNASVSGDIHELYFLLCHDESVGVHSWLWEIYKLDGASYVLYSSSTDQYKVFLIELGTYYIKLTINDGNNVKQSEPFNVVFS